MTTQRDMWLFQSCDDAHGVMREWLDRLLAADAADVTIVATFDDNYVFDIHNEAMSNELRDIDNRHANVDSDLDPEGWWVMPHD